MVMSCYPDLGVIAFLVYFVFPCRIDVFKRETILCSSSQLEIQGGINEFVLRTVFD